MVQTCDKTGMKKNFQLGNSNEFLVNGQFYDVHNCFSCEGVSLLVSGDVRIRFQPIPEFAPDGPGLELMISGITYLWFSPDFCSDELSTVQEMGYKEADDQDMDWLLGEEHWEPDMHFIIVFESGRILRLGCASAVFRTLV
jgi:hypothetical protein